ncbi:hypothetical protein ACFPM3_18040 [Streptomyces coeruleoprunus]|uniref:Uncharacterized protein n=1 Tax=Streptomyces coeruleoprunus TaxID=285563 RepID=A0ABV9XI59_9ACTN
MGEILQGHAGQQDAEAVSGQAPVNGHTVDSHGASGVRERLPQIVMQVAEGGGEEGFADGEKVFAEGVERADRVGAPVGVDQVELDAAELSPVGERGPPR